MTSLKRSRAVEPEEPSKRLCGDAHHGTGDSQNPSTPLLPANQPLRPPHSYKWVNLDRVPLENLSGASDWLERVGNRLYRPNYTKLDMLPGIPLDYIKDFSKDPMVYIPKDIWDLRHLKMRGRHSWYFEFQRLADSLRGFPFDSQMFWDEFKQLKALTQRLQRDELDWYRRYKDRAYGEETVGKDGKKKPLLSWDKYRKYQSEPIRISQFGKYERILRRAPVGMSRGTKRSAGHLEDSDTQVPAKKPRSTDNEADPVGLTDSVDLNEQQQPPLPPLTFNTNARDQMHRHKKGKATDEPPAYKAEHKEARTGACADYAWMAENDETEQRYQQQDALRDGAAPRARGFTQAENQRLDYWKREWSGDQESLPYHPFPKVEDYTPNNEGIYQCFHKDFDCAEGTCSHSCCKNGYDVKGLKKAIAKAIRTYKAQVERMIENGLLDKRHKIWPNWCDDRLRKKVNEAKKLSDARHAEETMEANEVDDPISEPDPQAAAAVAAASAAALAAQTARQAVERDEKIKSDMKIVNQCYRRARMCEEQKKYPNLALFEAWWAATRKATQLLPLTAEERALLDSPEPSALSDKKPVRQKAPAVQSTAEQSRVEEPEQGDNDFDPLFDDPPDGMAPEAEVSQQEEEAFDPLFDEPQDYGSEGFGDPLLDDAELDEYIV